MHTVSAWLYRGSSWLAILGATALYVFFIATVMPEQSTQSAAYAGDWGAPDRHFFYTPDELYTAIASWGDTGRSDYIAFRLGLDIIWALAYTAFLVTITSKALAYAYPANHPLRLLNLLPLITLLTDYAENALGIAITGLWPGRYDLLVWLAAACTATKWSSLLIAHAVMLFALTVATRQRFVKQLK